MQPLHMPAPSLKKSSCLTCRQRRKKCDKVKPVCQSCVTSGFSCSWYDKDERGAGGATSESQGRLGRVPERQESGRSKHKPILPRPAVESVSYTRQQPQLQDRTQAEVPLRPSLAQMCPTSARPARPVYEPEFGGSISGAPEAVPTPGYYNATFTDSADSSFDDLWPQNQSQSLTRSRAPVQPSSVRRDTTNRTSLETTSIINELGLVMNVLCKNIPRSVNVNVSIRASYFSYVLSQYGSQQVRQFFQPPPMRMRDYLISRMVRTGATTWFFYLGAKIFEQLNKRNRHAMARPFVHWINNCDEQITNALNPNLSVEELEIHLFGLLELIFLKFVAINTQAGYSLFRRSVPVFVRLVSSDPSLLVEHQGLLLISVTRALDFHRGEVKRFVFRDSMIAFALGTPSFVQYDTSDCSTIPFVARPLEWAHGIPAEFVVCIVQVNAWRASNPGIPNANDWPALVLQTSTWIPRATDLVGEDSCEDSYKVIARLAVQETWRHAVLSYIYMGMCLVSSYDPRVQHSVQQILRLMDVVSESPLNVQLFLPYLTAGLAARYEHQRAAVRDKIASFFDNRIWILPGAEFIKVLDHLWHGAAAGGGPVTWDDYVYSRRAVLPIL